MEEYRSRPDISGKKIVIAPDFHDLMHSIWHCDNRRLHLQRAWEFKWSMELRAMTTCKLGLHSPGQMWKREGDVWVTAKACHFCGKRLTEYQPE